MLRRLTASALFGVALLTLTATGQPPPAEKKAPEKKADPLDGLIAAALANDPDIRIARAKAQLADAEVAKARQAVTQRVLALNAGIEEQRKAAETATLTIHAYEQQMRNTQERIKGGAAPQAELIDLQIRVQSAHEKLESAKAKLAQYEAELKLITGGDKPAAAVPGDPNDAAIRAAVEFLKTHPRADAGGDGSNAKFVIEALNALGAVPRGPTGPIPDRLRAALDKKVKLAPKGEKVTFDQALVVFKKEAGLDVMVRLLVKVDGAVISEGEELTVAAWFQMFADFNPDARFLVREYGLLVTAPTLNPPPDAISVFDFWKQKPAAKE